MGSSGCEAKAVNTSAKWIPHDIGLEKVCALILQILATSNKLKHKDSRIEIHTFY